MNTSTTPKTTHATTPATTHATTPKTTPATTPATTPTTQSFKDSLSQKERKAYEIAEKFLETSFDLKKSIGFKKWWATKSI